MGHMRIGVIRTELLIHQDSDKPGAVCAQCIGRRAASAGRIGGYVDLRQAQCRALRGCRYFSATDSAYTVGLFAAGIDKRIAGSNGRDRVVFQLNNSSVIAIGRYGQQAASNGIAAARSLQLQTCGHQSDRLQAVALVCQLDDITPACIC